MIDNFQMTFHHIGKPVPLESIKENKDTKYSPLFDMYSLDMKNDLSIPIELHAFGENSSLDARIQKETHVAFKVNDIEAALQGKEIVMPLYQPFAGYRCAMVIINRQLIELRLKGNWLMLIWSGPFYTFYLLHFCYSTIIRQKRGKSCILVELIWQ